MSLELFNEGKTNRELTLLNAQEVKGLGVFFDFITATEEQELLRNIDCNPWLADLKRRVQHYGYKYDYRARRLDKSSYIGRIPVWMDFLSHRLHEKGTVKFMPDQAIVNEYVDDQGIAPHIDCEPCFGDTIVSVSLGGSCVFDFEREPGAEDRISLFLEPRTLVVMTSESRFNWFHGIPSRKSDRFNGSKFKRQRRVSITFRKVII